MMSIILLFANTFLKEANSCSNKMISWQTEARECVCVCVCVCVCSVVSNSLRPHGLQPTRLLCPWNFPGKNTGVGCHFLLQGIFLTQRSSFASPALAGRFFTTMPCGKQILKWRLLSLLSWVKLHFLNPMPSSLLVYFSLFWWNISPSNFPRKRMPGR